VGPVSNLHGGRDDPPDSASHWGRHASIRQSDVRRPATAHDVIFRQAERAEIHNALRLILGSGGRLAAEEHLVDFLRFAVYRGIDLNDIWLAERCGQLAWAILPVTSPGRTMLLFSPTYVPLSIRDTSVRPLIERVLEDYQARDVDLAQVLLDPVETEAVEVFRASGFEPLAELIYLERSVGRGHHESSADALSWETYAPTSHAQFARIVAATYEQSLDCPRLNGRRHIDDVLAGHKASGEFDPNLWFILREGSAREGSVAGMGKPLGVLLMNRSTRTDALELVYLGLTPAARGRRLGDVLMRHALATAARVGSRTISLAVDSQNTPALRLYHRHAMSKICTRLALMRDLRAFPAPRAGAPG
jgi:mycothiol synthase